MAHSTAAPAGNPRISLTGYVTASAWAHFGFTYAHWFHSWRGTALFVPLHAGCRALRPLVPAAGRFTESLYWRHRWFTDWVDRQHPALAVEIGAGLSARGIAHAEAHEDCVWIDYELEDMVLAKRQRLSGRRLPDNYHLEPGDLLGGDLGAQLRGSPGRTVALTEGVIDYLDSEEKQRAFNAIAHILTRLGGGRYLLEIHPREHLARFGPATTVVLTALKQISGRDLGAQLFRNADAAITALRAAGFARARVIPDNELADAQKAPPPDQRAFVLIEAEV